MKLSNMSRCAMAFCAAAAMLSGCGGPQTPIGAPGAMAQGRTIATHAGREGSWMQPEAKAENLLYVSDYLNDDVTVVTYPGGKLVGTLTGFSTPYGLCVDAAGDVWITSSSQIIEYAHGGANPIATLSDSGYTTTDCSVDPTTGNLAVSERPAGIAVYAHASGSPEQYVDRTRKQRISSFGYCSYDDKGDLFALGVSTRFLRARLAQLRAGSKALVGINVRRLVGIDAGLQWDGEHVALGGVNAIEQYTVSGKTATQVGSTPLKGLGNGGQSDFWIQGKTVVVVPFTDESGPSHVFLYKYPAGGKPLKKIGGFKSAGSATVSLAQR